MFAKAVRSVVVSGILVVLVGPTAPAVADVGSAPEVVVSVVTEAELAAAPSAAAAVEDDFLEAQARAGVVVDASQIRSAAVGEAQVVWEAGAEVEQLTLATISEGGEAVGTEVAQSVVPSANQPELAPADAQGLGSTTLLEMKGGSWDGGYCTTTTVSEQKLTQCFERYQVKNDGSTTRDYYYYGRWATAEGESNTGPLPDWIPTRIDIRSRPWAGKRGNFATLINYWPKESNSSCGSGGTISVGYKGLSGSFDLRNCAETSPVIDASSISMGAIFDQGASFSGRVRSTDFSMIFSTYQGKSAAMADYGYAKFCKNTYATCEGVLRRDGW